MARSAQVLTLGILLTGLLITAGAHRLAAQPTALLTEGLIVDRSVTITPGTYRLASPDIDTPVIVIRGDGITVDFNGAVLEGGPRDADPDSFSGTGILIDGGARVTLKNAVVRGYKVGIRAQRSPELRLTGSDVSYNWKQRLHSGIEKESLLDWMSYHQNEKDEWLRFGAGIYLRECDRAEIDHNTAVHGQNGLMVTASTGLKIWNNTFQFLSAIGVGLYRVTDSTIMHNRIDWCVRGYSHGFYNRGQDSAGLLMYEQSINNVVAYNSVTHGGDGLFLWAGQSTMDTGRGGSNDNLFYRNDFSHAPTNGIEATFSRNRFIENRIDDSWHGVWGGYSYGSVWYGNRFARNAEAIAIEHGQGNEISVNTFDRDHTAIHLWQNPTQDPDWGYPKHRDTRSRDYRIEQNTFSGHEVGLILRDTADVRLWRNQFRDSGERIRREADTSGFVELDEPPGVIMLHAEDGMPAPLLGGLDAMIPDGAGRGRHTIIVDEWGPYDWKSPKLWPVLDGGGHVLPYPRRAKAEGLFDGPVRLNVLGPEGTWTLVSARGADVTPARAQVGDVVSVTPRGRIVDYDIVLEYRGREVVSPRGAVTPAGQPYRLSYSRFFAPVNWTIRFFEYPESVHPVKQPEAFAKVLAGTPVKTVTADRIDYLSGREFEDGLARDHFALVAEGTVDLPPGDYTLQVISDDGARVWADGGLILDAWAPHGSRVDTTPIQGGTRRLRVEYYEVAGWAEMRLDILKRR